MITVEELLDLLESVEDKSIHVELFDLSEGERFSPEGAEILYDGGNPQVERNVDINFVINYE